MTSKTVSGALYLDVLSLERCLNFVHDAKITVRVR